MKKRKMRHLKCYNNSFKLLIMVQNVKTRLQIVFSWWKFWKSAGWCPFPMSGLYKALEVRVF